jgi:hypothetical protein
MAGLKAQVGRVPVRSARKRIEVSVVVIMNTFMTDDKRHQGAIGRGEGCEPRGVLDLTAKRPEAERPGYRFAPCTLASFGGLSGSLAYGRRFGR